MVQKLSRGYTLENWAKGLRLVSRNMSLEPRSERVGTRLRGRTWVCVLVQRVFAAGNEQFGRSLSLVAYGAKTPPAVHAGEFGKMPSIGRPTFVAGTAVAARREALAAARRRGE